MKTKISPTLRRVCVMLVGLVFLISGMLKLMDPVGTGLIVSEYLKFLHLGLLSGAAKGLGVALSLLEALCGAAMLAGVWHKVIAWIVITLLGGFTLLTLLLLIFNPPMDCGCFGEALHLTHLQSLLKNILLIALALIGFLGGSHRVRKAKYAVWGVVAALIVGFGVYSLVELPLIDFTAYSPGAEDAPLSFSDMEGEYAEELLQGEEVIVASAYQPDRLDWRDWERVSQAFAEAQGAGMRPVLLLTDLNNVPVDLLDYAYSSDYKTLITLNRSNGGLTYISDGMIVTKWAAGTPISAQKLLALQERGPIEVAALRIVHGRVGLEGLLLLSIVGLILI